MNALFLENHQKVGLQLAKKLKPTFIYQGGVLSLWQPSANNAWENIAREKIPNDKYDVYKTLAHISVNVRLIWENKMSGAEVLLEQLQQLKVVSQDKEMTVYAETSLKAVSEMLENPERAEIVLSCYQENVKPQVTKWMRLATNEVLSKLDNTVTQWMQKYQIELQDTKTIVACTHGPRKRLAEAQYFNSLYKKANVREEEIDNVHLYATEVLPYQFSEPEQLERKLIDELLIPSQTNSLLGKELLASPLAMYEDILAHDAQNWLEKKKCPYHQQ